MKQTSDKEDRMILKNKDILKIKPDLKLCSNHYEDKQIYHRYWNSKRQGMVRYDDRTKWYKAKNV